MTIHPESAAADLSRSTVRGAMQLGLFQCEPADDVRVVARTMAERSVHSVVVGGIQRRDHSGEYLTWGIVSDLDLVRALASGDPAVTAGQMAGSAIVAISPRDTLEQATRLMADYDMTHLIVVSPETGKPVGMLSTLDIARAVDGP